MICPLYYAGDDMDDSFDFDYLIPFCQNLWRNKDILVNRKYQCLYKTIVSRVYYSAFHHAKSWLEINHNFKTREFNYETGKMQNIGGLSEHVQVFKELRKIAKDYKSLKHEFFSASYKLEDLFNNRVDADYDETSIFKEMDVTDAIENAMFIVNLLKFN